MAKKQKKQRKVLMKKRRLLMFIQLSEIAASIAVSIGIGIWISLSVKRQNFIIGSEVFVPPLVLSSLFFLAWKLNPVWEKIIFGEKEEKV